MCWKTILRGTLQLSMEPSHFCIVCRGVPMYENMSVTISHYALLGWVKSVREKGSNNLFRYCKKGKGDEIMFWIFSHSACVIDGGRT